MTNSEKRFLEAIETYFHANDYRPHQFKETLNNYPNAPKNLAIREGFEAALEKKTITPAIWEGLTNSLIDTQEEVDQVLQAIWDYVYEEGPLPEW